MDFDSHPLSMPPATIDTEGGYPRPFGRYEILRALGTGGMATLYLARMRGPMGFEKLVAIKRIHPHLANDPNFVAMFLDEARIAAKINHPNVVQIYELGETEGTYYIAMEYLQGESLAAVGNQVVKRHRRFPPAIAAHIIASVCEGLHAAHEMTDERGDPLGIVHRDVSPHNVFVTYDGSVKLLDFGVAKAVGRMAHTASGMLKGKTAYMSPEQVTGQPLDRRSDLFALGVILYEITVGRRLFKAENDVAVLHKVVECKVPSPRALVHDYPGVLEGVVLRALAKDRNQRFQTAREMQEMLERFVELSGERAGAAALAGLMQESFAENMRQKKADALAALRGEVPTLGGLETPPQSGASGSLHFVDAGLPPEVVYASGAGPALRTRRRLTLAGVALAALAAGALLYARRAGSIDVRSDPAGADVYVDGDGPRCSTPCVLKGVSLWGMHEVEARRAGFETARRRVRLGGLGLRQGSASTQVSLGLRPNPSFDAPTPAR